MLRAQRQNCLKIRDRPTFIDTPDAGKCKQKPSAKRINNTKSSCCDNYPDNFRYCISIVMRMCVCVCVFFSEFRFFTFLFHFLIGLSCETINTRGNDLCSNFSNKLFVLICRIGSSEHICWAQWENAPLLGLSYFKFWWQYIKGLNGWHERNAKFYSYKRDSQTKSMSIRSLLV